MNTPSFARIFMRKINIHCSKDYECDDNNACTTDTCDNAICVYEEKLCEECGKDVKIEIKTTEYPQEIEWDILDSKLNSIVMSNVYYDIQNYLYIEEKCLQYGSYIFSISCGDNEQNQDGFFIFNVGDIIIDNDTLSQYTFIESTFIICNLNSQCFDYNGCTVDICNTTTNLCENTALENCGNCSFVD